MQEKLWAEFSFHRLEEVNLWEEDAGRGSQLQESGGSLNGPRSSLSLLLATASIHLLHALLYSCSEEHFVSLTSASSSALLQNQEATKDHLLT